MTDKEMCLMFRRIVRLTICFGFLAAVLAGGVAAKDGFKLTVTLDPIPPLTQTTLVLNCEFALGRRALGVRTGREEALGRAAMCWTPAPTVCEARLVPQGCLLAENNASSGGGLPPTPPPHTSVGRLDRARRGRPGAGGQRFAS